MPRAFFSKELTLEVMCIFVYACVCTLITQSYLNLCDLWTATCQALLSMGFPRQEYWSG